MTLVDRSKLWQAGAVLAVLVAAAGVSMVLTGARGEAPGEEPERVAAPLVRVQRVAVDDVPVRVHSQGVVRARSEIEVTPEVSGVVTAVHPGFVAGGTFEAGETLLRIDPRDYELQLTRAQAEHARATAQAAAAEAEIAEIEAHLADAALEAQRQESLYQREVATSAERDRAAFAKARAEAQLQRARAQHQSSTATVAAAQSAVAQAELDLERTQVSLPINGRVTETQVSVGQHVTARQRVGTVYSTDRLEVPVLLEARELAWFDVGENGAAATLTSTYAGEAHTWHGRAARIGGRVDDQTRMVQVIIELDFDNAHEQTNVETPQLAAPLAGMFMEVVLHGRTLHGVVAIPRHALRPGRRVWVAHAGRLDIREVELAHYDERHAYVRDGLEDGELVVTGMLESPAHNMRIQTVLEDELEVRRRR